MVADVHRTLLYGGIFFYPADKKSPNGKLRWAAGAGLAGVVGIFHLVEFVGRVGLGLEWIGFGWLVGVELDLNLWSWLLESFNANSDILDTCRGSKKRHAKCAAMDARGVAKQICTCGMIRLVSFYCRVLYEVFPMSLLVEQAGGAAFTGKIRVRPTPPVLPDVNAHCCVVNSTRKREFVDNDWSYAPLRYLHQIDVRWHEGVWCEDFSKFMAGFGDQTYRHPRSVPCLFGKLGGCGGGEGVVCKARIVIPLGAGDDCGFRSMLCCVSRVMLSNDGDK